MKVLLLVCAIVFVLGGLLCHFSRTIGLRDFRAKVEGKAAAALVPSCCALLVTPPGTTAAGCGCTSSQLGPLAAARPPSCGDHRSLGAQLLGTDAPKWDWAWSPCVHPVILPDTRVPEKGVHCNLVFL